MLHKGNKIRNVSSIGLFGLYFFFVLPRQWDIVEKTLGFGSVYRTSYLSIASIAILSILLIFVIYKWLRPSKLIRRALYIGISFFCASTLFYSIWTRLIVEHDRITSIRPFYNQTVLIDSISHASVDKVEDDEGNESAVLIFTLTENRSVQFVFDHHLMEGFKKISKELKKRKIKID